MSSAFAWGLSESSSVSRCRRPTPRESSRTSAPALEDVPLFWLAGPITGLIVQPLVGYYSDRTWTRFGRRRPYFLVGAVLAAFTLVAMPNATTLWVAVLMLWVLDASLNFTMGPFRAFVADQMSAAAAGHRLSHVHVLCERRRRRRQPAALGVHDSSASRRMLPPGEISAGGEVRVRRGGDLLIAAVCWSALHDARVSARDAREIRRRRSRTRSATDRPPRCAAMPSSGSRWDRRACSSR